MQAGKKHFAILIVAGLVLVAYSIIRMKLFGPTQVPDAFRKEYLSEKEHDVNEIGNDLFGNKADSYEKNPGKIMRNKSKSKRYFASNEKKRLKDSSKNKFENIGKKTMQKETMKFAKKVVDYTENSSQTTINKSKNFGDPNSDTYKEWIKSSQSLNIYSALTSKPKQKQRKTKTILIYTPLFKDKEWPNLKENQLRDYLKNYKCPVKNCVLSYDQSKLPQSDVVVFHSRDILNPEDLRTKSDTVRPDDQIWVYFTSESPLNSKTDVILDNVFDWTMTYKYNSDIWLPYSRYYPLKKHEAEDVEVVDFAKTKTKLISWLVSNCGLMRDAVVYELQNYLNVDVGGKCANHFSNTFQCNDPNDCDKKISEYKFYLAFENVHCDYYVTEKYWYRAIRNNVVPIVLGAGPYNDPKAVIPGSYIDILEYDSIADLVKYIKYLDKNDTAYNEYFNWKKKYKVWKPVCDWPFEPYWTCEICARLNNGVQRRTRQLSSFWGTNNNCEGRISKLRQFLEISGHDFTTDYKTHPINPSLNNVDGNIKEVEYETEVEYEKETAHEIEGSLEDGVKDSNNNKLPIIETFDSKYDNSKTRMAISCLFLISLVGTIYYLFKLC